MMEYNMSDIGMIEERQTSVLVFIQILYVIVNNF